MTATAELLKAIATNDADVTKLFDTEDDGRKTDPNHNMSKADHDKIVDLNKKTEAIQHQVKDQQESEGIRGATRERTKKLGLPTDDTPIPGGLSDDEKRKKAAKTLGEQFVHSTEFKAWLKAVAPNGNVSEKQSVGNSPAFPVESKALITGLADASAGAFISNDLKPFVGLPFRPIQILDLITSGSTGSDVVEFPREVSRTNAAAAVAEATATGGASGTKPESAFVLEKVTTSVRTIAHWIPATKRALSDAGQVKTLIDAFLRSGLREVLATQVLTGDGVGENLLGLMNTVGITVQAFDTNILTTSRKGRTKVRTVGRATPTGYVMNPIDWEAFDLLQDNEARYYFGGPSVLGTPRLWGLPVAEEEGMTAGLAAVGDLRMAVLWDREQATISASDSHSDFFIRNMVAILAELRAAFGVLRPAAIVSLDLTL